MSNVSLSSKSPAVPAQSEAPSARAIAAKLIDAACGKPDSVIMLEALRISTHESMMLPTRSHLSVLLGYIGYLEDKLVETKIALENLNQSLEDAKRV